MTAPGTIRPEPMTPAAAARPRDPSARVLLPICLEAKFRGTTGFRKFFADWDALREWIASDDSASTTSGLNALTVVRRDPSAGPPPADPAEPRKWMPT